MLTRSLGGRFNKGERAVWLTTAILFATPSSLPLYQRLGFETVATADVYAWAGR